MKRKSVIVLVAMILLLGSAVGLTGTIWLDCPYFGCEDGGSACKDAGYPMLGCYWILCLYGGSIICPPPGG
jgi:hypothetical protein